MEGLCTVLDTSHTCGRTCVRLPPLWKMCFACFKNVPSISYSQGCTMCFISSFGHKCEERYYILENIFIPGQVFFSPFPQIFWETSTHVATLWLCTDLPEQAATLGSVCQSRIGARSHVTYWYVDHVTME